jgi:hypothetical protein
VTIGPGVDGPQILVADANGNPVIRLGALSATRRGLSVAPDGAAADFLRVSDVGIAWPALTSAWGKSTDFISITSTMFTDTYITWVERLTYGTVRGRFRIACDGGTTGEARVEAWAGTGTYSSVRSLSAGAVHDLDLIWNGHGITLNSGPVTFSLQVRRTDGDGACNVYAPTSPLHIGSFADATADGWHSSPARKERE